MNVQLPRTPRRPVTFTGQAEIVARNIAADNYDSISVKNDSVNTLYYSVDGGNTWTTLFPGEQNTFDRYTNSSTFHIKASAAASACRVTLWLQEPERI